MELQGKYTWSLRNVGEIQDQAAKLLRITNIVPFRLIKGPIIEEIDE